MSDIRTYNDLLQEKKRLEAALVIQKGVIREDLIELREEFRPVLNVLSIVGKLTNRNRSNPLIALGINLVGEVFLKNMAVSSSSKIMRLVGPFVAKKVSTYFVNKEGGTFLQKLAGIWKKNKSNGHAVD